MDRPPLLELRGIDKAFGDDFALQGVDIDLLPGEAHVIVGENGSGKSALMKIVVGYYRRDGGRVIFNGKEVEFPTFHDALRAGLSYQHQDLQLFDNLSVAENVYFDRLSRGGGLLPTVHPLSILRDCRILFDDLGIALDPTAPLGTLGYAERQLVAVVKAVVPDASVVIFDEPSAAMSESEREILFTLVGRLKSRGAGIFYISHRLDEIARVGDRVTVMHRGRVVGTRASGVDRDSLVNLMTGEVHRDRYPRLPSSLGRTILSVRNLESEPVLKGVTFDLRKGEILGITGLMGSGRTRLAHCLIGELPPTGGVVVVDGREVDFSHPADARARGLSMVPEDREQNGLFHRLDLMRNVTVSSLRRFRRRLGLAERDMRGLARDYASRLAIRPERLEAEMTDFSGGNQQKAMVARAFMDRASIYILDEPTRGVDVAARVDIYNAMNDLVAKGASVILISSEIEEILGMCDRVLVLAGGRIAADMTRDEATKERIIDFATDDE